MKKYPVIIIFLITMLLVCGETVMAKERLGKPLGVLANGVEDRVVISWEPVKKADGYEVFEKAEGEKAFTKVKVTKKRKIVLKKKARGRRYQYKVGHIERKRRSFTESSEKKWRR